MTGALWIDPLVSILIVAVIAWGTWGLLKDSVAMSLLGVPHPQRKEVQSQNERGVAGFVRDSVEYVFRQLPVWTNYFWSVYVRGRYTERVFTGDSRGVSGELLFAALHRAGYSPRPRSVSAADGLRLADCYIVAVNRCAPPANRPRPRWPPSRPPSR